MVPATYVFSIAGKSGGACNSAAELKTIRIKLIFDLYDMMTNGMQDVLDDTRRNAQAVSDFKNSFDRQTGQLFDQAAQIGFFRAAHDDMAVKNNHIVCFYVKTELHGFSENSGGYVHNECI